MPERILRSGVREDDIYMMSHPMRWPHMVLPVKRAGADGQMEIGTMVAIEDFQTYVFLTFMYHGEAIMQQVQHIHKNGKPDPDGVKFIKYDSFDAIVDDKWRVD